MSALPAAAPVPPSPRPVRSSPTPAASSAAALHGASSSTSAPASSAPPAPRVRRVEPTADVVRVVPWPDAVIDRLGYDPRSLYVETFWLGILGPTSTWLMRCFAAGLDQHPSGFALEAADTARALGLGERTGRNSPFRRAMARCVKFEVARRESADSLAVRRRLPPLPRRHLIHLPVSLQERHRLWTSSVRTSAVLDEARRHARRLAIGLVASGEERDVFEPQLVRWGVHPALAHEAAEWAFTLQRAGSRSPRTDRAG
jgi:hypothetical protein